MKGKIVFLMIAFSIFNQSSYAQNYALKIKKRDIITIDNNRYKMSDKWLPHGKNSYDGVIGLISILEKSKTGQKVLKVASKKASSYGETLTDIIKPGDGSLTDTTLTRRFASHNPHQVVFESKSQVFINRDLGIVDAVLDLAHELTHYNFREPFNPYSSDFKLSDFVAQTIEGTGGEVQAFLVECQVLFELFPDYTRQRKNCERMIDPKSGTFSKNEGVKHFYRVGSYLDNFRRKIKQNGDDKGVDAVLKQVSDKEALFISSAWSMPYPLAAVHEYTTIMERVCENDLRRLNLIEAQRLRGPASSQERDHYNTFKSNYQKRCRGMNKP